MRRALTLTVAVSLVLAMAAGSASAAGGGDTAVGWGRSDYGQGNIPAGLTDVAAISAGGFHNLALTEDGTVVGWGFNSSGQATVPAGLTGVAEVSAGHAHSLALRSDGTVVGWGYNSDGQASRPAGLTGVVAIAAGGYHSLALRSDGTVVGWGFNSSGQATVPAGLTDVVAISAGRGHSLALRSDGTVVGWGYNSYGQASRPAGLTGVVAIAAGGYHSLALRSDGTVVGWGFNSSGQATVPAGLTDVVAISAGRGHSLALRSDGTVVGWGYNSDGQASRPAGLTGVVAIAAGGYHSLALRSDGTVVGWGFNRSGQASPPAGLTDVVAIAADHGHSLALNADGTVVGWGYNSYGQASPPAGLTGVVAISAGFENSLALVGVNQDPLLSYDDDIDVDEKTTAENWGEVEDPDGDMVTVSASIGYVVSNIYDGTWEWSFDPSDGPIESGPVTITAADGNGGTAQVTFFLGVSNVAPTVVDVSPPPGPIAIEDQPIAVSATFSDPAGSHDEPYTCAVDYGDRSGDRPGTVIDNVCVGPDHTYAAPGLYEVSVTVTDKDGGSGTRVSVDPVAVSAEVGAWGGGDYGQSTVPAGLTDVVAIAAGVYHTLALEADGAVVAWGDDRYGQSTVPVSLTDVVAIAACHGHSLAARADGTVVAWGEDGHGESTVPAGLTDTVAVSAGIRHSMALRADGTVVAWGDNSYGQSTVPAGLTEVVAIAAGAWHNLALRADGTVVAWGYDLDGRSTVPAGLTEVVEIDAYGHNLALLADGSVVAWGYDSHGQIDVPAGLTDVVAISTGIWHSLAAKQDGTVVGWGTSNEGQIDIPAGMNDVVAISAGAFHSVALGSVNQDPLLGVDVDSVAAGEGTTATNSGTVADPDGDAVTLSASIGAVTNNGNGTWTWGFASDDGPSESQTVTVFGADGHGGTVAVTFELTVSDVAPSATFSNDAPVDEGNSFTLALSDAVDPSGADTAAGFEYAFDCGSGYGVFDAGSSAVCATVDNGTLAVAAMIRDKDGTQREYTSTAGVANLAPAVAIDSLVDQAGAEIGVDVEIGMVGVPIDLLGSFTDAGVIDTHTATIDWGDSAVDDLGSVVATAVGSHTYGAPGSYLVALAVTDNDLGVGTATFAIEVVDASGALTTTVDDLLDLGLDEAVDLLIGNNGGKGNNGAIDKLEEGKRSAGLVKLRQVVRSLERAEASDPGLDLATFKGLMTLAARSVALDAIAEADANSSGPAADAILLAASGQVDDGDALVTALDYRGAIEKYRKAVKTANQLL